MKLIREELGEDTHQLSDAEEFRTSSEEIEMHPDEVKEKLAKEIKRFKSSDDIAPAEVWCCTNLY